MPVISKPAHARRIIRATLIGSDGCDAEGFTTRANAPVLELCRRLIAAGFDPHRPLHAYRDNVLCLRVSTISRGAALTVRSSGNGAPIFAPAEGAAASPMSKREPALVHPRTTEAGHDQSFAMRINAALMRHTTLSPARRLELMTAPEWTNRRLPTGETA